MFVALWIAVIITTKVTQNFSSNFPSNAPTHSPTHSPTDYPMRAPSTTYEALPIPGHIHYLNDDSNDSITLNETSLLIQAPDMVNKCVFLTDNIINMSHLIKIQQRKIHKDVIY